MKEVELKLLSELMMNSRRSDRELARAIGTSQPTLTRIRNKLEKEGYIQEYTMIPDFRKLGYEIAVLTFAKLGGTISSEELEQIRKLAREMAKETALECVLIARGMGLGYELAICSFHENYAAFLDFIRMITQFPHVNISNIDTFVISLSDVHYRNLTFSTLAKHLLTLKKENKSNS